MRKLLLLALTLLLLASCSHPAFITKSKDATRNYPTESFVKIVHTLKNPRCEPINKDCLKEFTLISGSGALIQGAKNHSNILTAAHVCEPSFGIRLSIFMLKNNLTKNDLSMYAYDINEKKYELEVVKSDHKNDICVMKSEDLKSRHELPIANIGPQRSSMYYNMAAPLGIFQRDTVLLFDGIFSGKLDIKARPGGPNKFDTYTIPSTGGSSGSPILNQQGEIVGVVSMGTNSFKHITLSPQYKKLFLFVKNL